MKNKLHQLIAILALAGTVAFLAGCGGGGGGDSASSGSTGGGGGGNNSGDLAFASVGGKTLHAHIAGTNTLWELRFTGSGTSGGYTHYENGTQLESGTYTYNKSGANTSSVTTSPNGQGVAATINLNWTTANSGTYQVTQFPESGTFNF